MSERIITLFGEEIVPEQLKAVGRSRAKKKSDEKTDDAKEDTITPETTDLAGTAIAEATNDITPAAEVTTQHSEPAPVVEAAPAEITAEPVSELPVVDNEEERATVIVAAVNETTPLQTSETTDAEPIMATPEIAAEETEPVVAESIAEENTDQPVAAETKKKEKSTPAILPDDWQGDKQYYSIGEVADLFKVKTSHIRFWTNEFKLKVRTTRKGDRLYTPAQIKELKAINNLVKERGFTLKGAKTRLKAPEKMEVETVDLKQSLLQLRNKLLAIKNQLK